MLRRAKALRNVLVFWMAPIAPSPDPFHGSPGSVGMRARTLAPNHRNQLGSTQARRAGIRSMVASTCSHWLRTNEVLRKSYATASRQRIRIGILSERYQAPRIGNKSTGESGEIGITCGKFF